MKEKFLAFLSILPFFIVFTFFMIAPLIWIVFNAFVGGKIKFPFGKIKLP